MEEKINLHIENPGGERTYILPPHPTACVPVSEETVCPDEPVSAKESISDLVRQAVNAVRGELLQVLEADLETRVRQIQTELQIELQSEIKTELKEIGFDAQIKKP